MPGWTLIAIRSLGAIVMLFILTRILGKKQISQLTFFEYITGIALGDLVGFMSTDIEAHYFHGVVSLLIWFIVPLFFERMSLRSKSLRRWLEGNSTVFIKDGKVMESNLRKERYTGDELMEQLRTKNVFNPADVEFALLEPSGQLSIMLKRDKQPLTPSDIGLAVPYVKEPKVVVMDGNIQDETLADLGLTRGWLMEELGRMGVPLNNVFLCVADTFGQIYVDLYDDLAEVHVPSAKELILVSLKKVQAELELYALQSSSMEERRHYVSCAQSIQTVLDRAVPVLQRM